MPRDGAGIYHRPVGTDAVPDTSIESSKYNTNVADVELDLNLPRPIVAGGTGATSAASALVNLGGENANQVVTNYDSFTFVAGSFHSAAGATSAPTTNAFSGICYMTDSNNMVLEARDATTGKLYVRMKTGGTWGAWSLGASADFVLKAGDTMTGNLTIGAGGAGATPSALIVNGGSAAGGGGKINLQKNGADVWIIGERDAIYGSGSDNNFAFHNQALGGPALEIAAADNTVAANAKITAIGTVTAGAGAVSGGYYFGNSGTKSLTYDGTNFTLNGGAFYTSNDIAIQGGGTTGTLYFGAPSNLKYLQYDGTYFDLTDQLKVTGNVFSLLSATTGAYHFGSTGTKYLTYDGSNFQFVGGHVMINLPGSLLSYGGVYTGYSNTTSGTYFFGSSGTKYLTSDGTNYGFGSTGNLSLGGTFTANSSQGLTVTGYGGSNPYVVNVTQSNPNWGSMFMQALHYPGVWAGQNWDIGGAASFSLRSDATAQKSGGATTWVISSDARIKDVSGDYTSGLDAIAALRPVRFTYKGNQTYGPPSHFADGLLEKPEGFEKIEKTAPVAPYANSPNSGVARNGTEYIGLIAQEAEVTMPELIIKEKGYIDGTAVDDLRSADYTALTFALVNAIKELKARVEELEARF